MTTRATATAAAAALLGTTLAANAVTTRFGMVDVGFGLEATAGTYLAGLAFVLRDTVQDMAGRRAVAALIIIGALLSYLVADPRIATASALAFLLSEFVDFGIYTPLRSRGYLRAAVASNVVGSVVDTVAFLAVAGFPILVALPGQVVGKTLVTVAVVALVAATRVRKAVAA